MYIRILFVQKTFDSLMIVLFKLFVTKDTAAPSKLFQSNCKTQSEIVLRVEVTLLIYFFQMQESSQQALPKTVTLPLKMCALNMFRERKFLIS